jgi:hypothetical protein
MSDPTCFGSLQVCATRVALLAANGQPSPGTDNGYVSDALIQVDLTIELDSDVDLSKQNGCGALCQSYFKQGAIKRATLAPTFCELDLQLGSLLVGGSLRRTAGLVPIGWQAPLSADAASNGVCVEFWTKAWDGTQQATPASLSNAAAYWHWVFGLSKFQLDKMTLQNDFLEFALTGFSTENANMSPLGPFNDWPTDIGDGGGITACLGIFLDDTLPEAGCEFIEVPAVES